jgi:LPS-assembly lipoprotein
MSSRLRIILATLALLPLAACGFHPMYGDAALQATHTPLQGNLLIETAKTREGQILKIALEDRLNPEGITFAQPDYRLQVTLTKALIPSVVKSDGTIQRYDVRFDSTFKLLHVGDTKVLLEGTMRRTGSYNVATNANFATYEAEQDIMERTLKEMAEDYVLRLSGYFAEKP